MVVFMKRKNCVLCVCMAMTFGVLAKEVRIGGAGGEAVVNLYGGVMTSWKSATSGEILAMARDYESCGRGVAICGGIPVFWPWAMANRPELEKVLVFTRGSDWKLKSRTADSVVIELNDNETMRRIWPHRFHLELEYRLDESDTLKAEFRATNTDSESYSCTELFHPFFRVGETAKTTISNTKGCHYYWRSEPEYGYRRMLENDFCGGFFKKTGPGFVVCEEGKPPYRHDLIDPVLKRKVEITYEGGRQLIMWNSGPDYSPCGKSDSPDFGRRFITVEAGNCYDDYAYTLKPGEVHKVRGVFRVKPL